MVACPCRHHGRRRLRLGAHLQRARLAGPALNAGGVIDRGTGRLSVELPPLPHEGVLLFDRLVRRRRDHQARVEVERDDLAVRRTEGHQAHSSLSQHKAALARHRFLRSGEILLSLPRRGGDLDGHPLPHRALAYRAHLPRHPLAGQARRISSASTPSATARSPSSSRRSSPASPVRFMPIISARWLRTGSAWRR